jgi:hypothetical protein
VTGDQWDHLRTQAREDLQREQAANDLKQAMADRDQAAGDSEQRRLDSEQRAIDHDLARRGNDPDAPTPSWYDLLRIEQRQAAVDRAQAARDAQQAALDLAQEGRDRSQAALDAARERLGPATGPAAVSQQEEIVAATMSRQLAAERRAAAADERARAADDRAAVALKRATAGAGGMGTVPVQ